MTTNTHDRPDDATSVPGYMTVAQCAKLLGLTAAGLYSRIRRGNIPVTRAGRTLLLSDEQILKLFASTRNYQYHDR